MRSVPKLQVGLVFKSKTKSNGNKFIMLSTITNYSSFFQKRTPVFAE